MEFIKKSIHVLSIILYFLIGIYAVVCIPMVLGYKPVVVLSGSMEPTYKTSSVIYYKSTSKDELKVGDTITYLDKKNQYVSHRIVSIENDLYETKGDANNIADEDKIPFENIKGKVAIKSIPYIGKYIKIVNDNMKITIIGAIIILLSEFLLSNVRVRDIKNRRKE